MTESRTIMPANDATCDLWCQQHGEENHFPLSACLFPAVFCLYRYREFLEEGGHDPRDFPEPTTVDFYVCADWFEEFDDEIAEWMRLALSWNLEPPTDTLKAIAAEIRRIRRVSRYARYGSNQHAANALAEIDRILNLETA